MVVLGIVIGILIMILAHKSGDADTMEFFGVVGGFLIIASIIGTFVCLVPISKSIVIDEKISMYQDENKKIENQINTLVKEYMTYEGSTLKEFASDSSITLVAMYPNLKSDELVKKQIDSYINNNNKIKEFLESKEINCVVAVIIFGLVAYLVSYVTMKSIKLRRLIIGTPTIVIQNGKIFAISVKIVYNNDTSIIIF